VIVTGGDALVDLVDDGGALRPFAGGGPFTTAIAFGRLDVPVGFLGPISRDHYGKMLSQQLVAAGVDTSLLHWSDAPTPRAVVHKQRDGKNEYTFELAHTSLVDLAPDDLPVLPQQAWAVYVGPWRSRAIRPPPHTRRSSIAKLAGARSSSTRT
jgi:fructokinase